MRVFRLASISLQAEGLRLRYAARRHVLQAVLLLVAVVTLLAGLVAGHVAVYALLAERLPPAGAAGTLAGLDLLLAMLIAWVALSRGPGREEREAAALAGLARGQIRQSLEWTALVASLLQSFNRRR
jgi:hypothetical protein